MKRLFIRCEASAWQNMCVTNWCSCGCAWLRYSILRGLKSSKWSARKTTTLMSSSRKTPLPRVSLAAKRKDVVEHKSQYCCYTWCSAH